MSSKNRRAFRIGVKKEEVKEYLCDLVDMVFKENKVILFGLRGSSGKSHHYNARNGLVDFQCMITDEFFKDKGTVTPLEDSGICPLIFVPRELVDDKWLKRS